MRPKRFAPVPFVTDALTAVPRFDIDLPPSPDGSSFAAYRAQSAPICAAALPDGTDPGSFAFRSTVFQLPDAVLFRASSSAQRMIRGPAELTQNPDGIMLAAQLEGTVTADYGSREVLVRPGDIYLTDYTQSYRSDVSDFTIVALLLRHERAPTALTVPTFHGEVLCAGSGGATLIRNALLTLFDTADNLSLAEANAAVEGVCTVATAAFRTAAGVTDVAASYGDLKAARRYVDAHLASAALTPARIEAELGLSRSSLYRLFEDHGGVGAYVLRERLERSMTALIEAGPNPIFRDIAEAHGFRSEGHFTRAFRSRYGITPRAPRELVQRRDLTSLQQMARAAGFNSFENWLVMAADGQKQSV